MALPRSVMIQSVVSAVSSVVTSAGGDPARLVSDITEMCASYPSLACEVDTMVDHRTGAPQTLAKIRGTVPIVFRGSRYNIPVVLWLPARYPHEAPQCYVAPTKDMIIRPAHTNVDGSGLVFLPYLADWSARRSRLVELCTVLASVFSGLPPVNAKPPGYDEQQEYERSVSRALAQSLSYSNGNSGGRGGSSSGAGSSGGSSNYPVAYATPATAAGAGTGSRGVNHNTPSHSLSHSSSFPSSSSSSPSSSSSSSSSSSLGYGGKTSSAATTGLPPAYSSSSGGAADGRNMRASSSPSTSSLQDDTSATIAASAASAKNAENDYMKDAINQKVNAKCEEVRGKIEAAGNRSDLLREGAEKIAAGLAQLKGEKDALEECIGILEGRDASVAAWVEEQDKLVKEIEANPDPDAILRPADALNDQLFDQVATIAAVDDVLFHLDSALREGVVELGPYLKCVRSLATQQFMAKALAIKINEIQARSLARAGGRGGGAGGPPPVYRK
jgi:ESCRT-I complex subunit TSG101